MAQLNGIQIAGIVSLSIFIIGIILNSVSIIVCTRKRLWKTPTFVFIAFMSFMNTVVLYYGSVSTFYQGFTNEFIANEIFFFCKTGLYSQVVSLQSSSWFLVSI